MHIILAFKLTLAFINRVLKHLFYKYFFSCSYFNVFSISSHHPFCCCYQFALHYLLRQYSNIRKYAYRSSALLRLQWMVPFFSIHGYRIVLPNNFFPKQSSYKVINNITNFDLKPAVFERREKKTKVQFCVLTGCSEGKNCNYNFSMWHFSTLMYVIYI